MFLPESSRLGQALPLCEALRIDALEYRRVTEHGVFTQRSLLGANSITAVKRKSCSPRAHSWLTRGDYPNGTEAPGHMCSVRTASTTQV